MSIDEEIKELKVQAFDLRQEQQRLQLIEQEIFKALNTKYKQKEELDEQSIGKDNSGTIPTE